VRERTRKGPISRPHLRALQSAELDSALQDYDEMFGCSYTSQAAAGPATAMSSFSSSEYCSCYAITDEEELKERRKRQAVSRWLGVRGERGIALMVVSVDTADARAKRQEQG
jgi:hypothetical protein